MGRPPKPESELVDRRPSRLANRNTPPATHGELGDPPEHVDFMVGHAWNELKALIPAGLAGQADRIAFEMFATLRAKQMTMPESFSLAEHKMLLEYLARFGLTPMDRSKIRMPTPPKEEKENPFAKFGQRPTMKVVK